jgi:hypothetical protein
MCIRASWLIISRLRIARPRPLDILSAGGMQAAPSDERATEDFSIEGSLAFKLPNGPSCLGLVPVP